MIRRREKANVAEVMNVVGEVEGMNCLIVDDMCDTGGTICKVAAALHKNGANEIYACFSHGDSIREMRSANLRKIAHQEDPIVTDTIPLDEKGLVLKRRTEGLRCLVGCRAYWQRGSNLFMMKRAFHFSLYKYLFVRLGREVMAEKFVIKADPVREGRGKNEFCASLASRQGKFPCKCLWWRRGSNCNHGSSRT